MKIEIIFIANILIIKSTLSIEASGIETDKIWRDYKKKFNLNFNSFNAERKSYQNLLSNLKKIDQSNLNLDKNHTLGITPFTHLSDEQFKKSMLMNINETISPPMEIETKSLLQPTVKGSFSDFIYNIFNPIPKSFSWVTQGYVTSVKYQANCGSCYAFATVAAIETVYAYANKIKPPIDLSEQQIIDCSNYLTNSNKKYKPNQGCNGGLPKTTLQYIIDNGLESLSDYPYTETTPFGSTPQTYQCKYSKSKNLYKISKYNQIKSLTQVKSMQIAIYRHGPLITWVNANNFQNYVSGIYDATKSQCNPNGVNHLVLIVGYGYDSASKKNYWLIKNSYGSSWGESGYIRIRSGSNVCGVESQPFYPIV